MPDQLPSAILDSANSFDSLFALNLDTKQRFDNILSGVQKPIDYPIPDYDKEMNPNGLPQDDLLNPNKMAGSIGEALFSSDPKVAAYATDKLRASQSRLPVNQRIGVPERFEYAKVMDKYLKGDYGYNPYMSIEDNEDFNYRYDYLNQNAFERVFKNIGVGIGRFAGSVVMKLGQNIGLLGSMIGNGIEEIFDSKNNNFMADVADNSLSRWFENVETDMKNSNLLSVFKPRGWDDMGFFNKLGQGALWTDEIADGAAFMGEMVASMYLMGGLGRIGFLGRLGETEINLAKSLGRLGSLGKYTGKTLDFALKTATGADDISGIGRWAFSTTSESASEASQLFKTRKDKLKSDRESGLNSYSDLEIDKIAGDSAAASFKANMLILSASNAFENRFIFGPLFKKLGIEKPNPQGELIDISKSTKNLDELAQASRKEYNYKTWLGKKLDWKNSNSRLRFYGSRALSATAAEGFWEENAQLAVERLAGADQLTLTSFIQKLKDQTVGAITGKDPEAAENIGLGGVIGILGTGIVGKVRGGDKLFQGERLKVEQDTRAAIETYEVFRKGFLNYQDIYVRDPQTGRPIMDSDGNLQIDETKAAGLFDGTNRFLSKLSAADKMSDPLLRKHIQDMAMKDYVVASKMAGIYDKVVQRFEALKDINKGDLENLGFDPNTTVDTTYLKDSLKEFGKIYESAYNSTPSKLKKGETEADERKRKDMLYDSATGVYSATKIINEYQSKLLDKDYPSVFSPDAEGNSSEIQQYNTTVYQEEALEQWYEAAKENGDFFDPYVEAERTRIRSERSRLAKAINLMVQDEGLVIEKGPKTLLQDKRGLYYTPNKYQGYTEDEIKVTRAIEEDNQKKYAEYLNIRSQQQYLANKFGSPINGIKNSKDYLAYIENIHKKDIEADNPPPSAAPPQGTPQAPAPPNPAGPTQAAATQPGQAATQPAQNPAATSPPTAAPTATKTTDYGVFVTKLSGMMVSMMEQQRKGEEVDYTPATTYIEDNQSAFGDRIKDMLLDFASASGNAMLQDVESGKFKQESQRTDTFDNTVILMENILQGDVEDTIADPVLDYLDGILTKIDEFNTAKNKLTDVEQKAIDLIKAKPELANSVLKPYVLIIIDPKSTAQQQKDALRGISDQYLSTGTSDEIGSVLGPELREAIDALGYPVPTGAEDTGFASDEKAKELLIKAGINPETGEPTPPENNLLEMTKVGKTSVFYDRTNNRFVYHTAKGNDTSYNQARKISNQITPRFFRVWFRELSTPEQRQHLDSTNGDFLSALREAQAGQLTDTLEIVLMRSIRDVKFSPIIMKDLTDVPASAWSSENGQPLDTFVSDFLLGEGNILEQNGFSGYDEQELMNMVIDLINQHPKGIRAKDIKQKEAENNSASALEDLEREFFDLTGLDLSQSLEIYNDEKQSLSGGQTKVSEPTQTPVTPTEGEKVLDYTQTDKKGRSHTYRSVTKTKDGVTTTSYQFERSDYPGEWHSADVPLEVAGITRDQFNPDEIVGDDGNLDDYDIKVSEVRIGEDGKMAATIKIVNKTDPTDFRNGINVTISGKPTVTPREAAEEKKGKTAAELVKQLSTLSYGDRVKSLVDQGIIDNMTSTYFGRITIIANINGHKVPFYRSYRGTDGKQKGTWYPFFGFGKMSDTTQDEEWLIKGTMPEIEGSYGVPKLAAYSGVFNALFNWDTELDGYYVTKGNPLRDSGMTSIKPSVNELVYGTKESGVIYSNPSTYSKIYDFIDTLKNSEDVPLTATPTPQVNEGISSVLDKIPEAYRQQATNDPEGFLLFISQRAQNYGDDWVRKVGNFGKIVRDKFSMVLPNGKTLVDYAIEKYPIPATATEAPKLTPKQKIDQIQDWIDRGIITPLAGEEYDMLNRIKKGKETPEDLTKLDNLYESSLKQVGAATEIGSTQADDATRDTEGSGVQTPPPPPPPKLTAAENSDEETQQSNNYIDVMVDNAKMGGYFVFPQTLPEEVQMDLTGGGARAIIKNGAIQLKTTDGPQQRQLIRQHNITKKMGERSNPVNFWSEDAEGNPLYKVRLELAGEANKDKYTPWVYDTSKGETNPSTGKPYMYPFIVAMVVDQEGKYVNFNDEGDIVDKTKGSPFGFVYFVQDYSEENLDISRRGVQLKTREPLSGSANFLNDSPLVDIRNALKSGVELLGTVVEVSSGKMGTYNVDNSGATYAKEPQLRSVKQMEDDGDIADTTPLVLGAGETYQYTSATTPGAPTQIVKVGQPYILDEKSGLKIPLRGKKLRDVTVNGKPFITPEFEKTIEELQGLGKRERGSIELEDDASEAERQVLENIFNVLRALVYSQNTPIFMNQTGTAITMLDNRPNNISLLDTEINYSTNIDTINNPFDPNSNSIDYEAFAKENFMSGAVPVEVTKGDKSFEKLNRRIIFKVDKDHQQVLESTGATVNVSKTKRVKATDYNTFVNKTFRKRGSDATFTITGYTGGMFVINKSNGTTITQTPADFMKQIRTLEEVTLPEPSEEVKDDFKNDIKLTEAEQRALNAEELTDEDLDNINFDC